MLQKEHRYDHIFQGYRFTEAREGEGGVVFRVACKEGTGEMRAVDVFDGVTLIYNRLRMETCFQKVKPVSGFLYINHCRAGCFEFALERGSYYFIREGDLCVTDPAYQEIQDSRIPEGRYDGISMNCIIRPAVCSACAGNLYRNTDDDCRSGAISPHFLYEGICRMECG